MNCNCNGNCNHYYEEASEHASCGCGNGNGGGCGQGNGGCGCTRKEYLGKNVTETKYFRVQTTTSRFVAPENNCRCGCCR